MTAPHWATDTGTHTSMNMSMSTNMSTDIQSMRMTMNTGQEKRYEERERGEIILVVSFVIISQHAHNMDA